jgi:hypothetical protein
MLNDAQRLALFLQMHRSIEEAATKMASQVMSADAPQLLYPPNAGFNRAETQAISKLRAIPGLESALRKVIASATSVPLYTLICILDGIGDPADYAGEWLGARIVPLPPDADNSEDVEPLRYEFMDSYWEWRKTRPDPGWRLDDYEGESPNEDATPSDG